MENQIIDLAFGPNEDGRMDMTFVGGKWRCAQYERRKAEEDNKRIQDNLDRKRTL